MPEISHFLAILINPFTNENLEKHKEKQKEAYIEAEKAEELKQFSEIGVQRFFIRSREEAEEQELEEQLRKAQMEENNEYWYPI